MKICIKCNLEKSDSEFGNRNKKCKDCYKEYQRLYRLNHKEKMKEYNDNYYQENKQEIIEGVKTYYFENRDKIAEYKTLYWEENREELTKKNKDYYQNNKERLGSQNKAYNQKHRKELNEKRNKRNKKNKIHLKLKERREKDPVFRISQNIRTYIRNSFKYKGLKKSTKTEIILGCSFKDFKSHIESQFECWMTWENYGKYNGDLNYGWDIDHIIPISIAQTEEEVLKLNHFTNLRPLCSYTNRHIKSDKIVYDNLIISPSNSF